jgi:hypothetical protein
MLAVHAGAPAEGPDKAAIFPPRFAKFHHQPRIGGKPGWVLVAAAVYRFRCLEVVPLLTGDLAGTAACTQVGIEQYCVAHVPTPF